MQRCLQVNIYTLIDIDTDTDIDIPRALVNLRSIVVATGVKLIACHSHYNSPPTFVCVQTDIDPFVERPYCC